MELMPVLYVQACMSSIFNRVFTNIHPVVGHLIGCKHCSDRLFHECSFGSRVKPRWALNKKNWHWCWYPFFFSLFIEVGISSQQVRMAFHSRGNERALFVWTSSSCCAILHRRPKSRLHGNYTTKKSQKSIDRRLFSRFPKHSRKTKPIAPVGKEDLEDCMNQQKEGRPVVRRARGLHRLASILDAAETVFAKEGFDSATTHQIAAQAEISPGSLYRFFSNKEEIAQALAARYVEALQRVYGTSLSLEAAALPFSHCLHHVLDSLIAFQLAHPAFDTLFDTPPSLAVAGLTQQLPKELQTRFELGFQARAPHLPVTQRRLSATITVQLFKALPPLILQAEERGRKFLVTVRNTLCETSPEPNLGRS